MLWRRSSASRTGRTLQLAALGLIALLACALYLPFLRNPRVFDDQVFFSHTLFAYYATHPLGLVTRAPAYFSLAFTEILFARIEAHRLLSLLFHCGCALALYQLIYRLLRDAQAQAAPATDAGQRSAVACAFTVAAAFALHPVAVYGAAYLVQRSIVLGTLFSLLSLLLFWHGMQRRAYSGALWAALAFSLAVLSKEHSILLPAIALPLAWLANSGRAFSLRYVALYWAACAPAAAFVTLLMKQLLGQVYEPHVAQIAGQIATSAGTGGAVLSWPQSAVTQAGLFFRYLATWAWPQTSAMAVDLRVDPTADWSPGWIALKVAAFVAVALAGGLLVRRRGRAGIVGVGVLYAWILFLAEMSVPRFQEVYVLYRSYLWAPGIALALAAILDRFGSRAALALFLAAGPILFVQAQDRLATFSSSLRLWEDAASKLPAHAVPWGSRVLYEVGREYLYSGRPDQAIAAAERCMATYPGTWQCVYARGAIHLHLEQFEAALPYLERAAEMQPTSGIAQHRIGLVLEKLERIEAAKQRYRKAAALGYRGGAMELGRLGGSTTGSRGPGGRAAP